MYNQSAQPFCTNCGHYLPVDAAQCPRCGVAVGTPPAGGSGQPAYPPPYAPPLPPPLPNTPQVAAGAVARVRQRRLQRNIGAQGQRSPNRVPGCVIALLILAVLAVPFVGIALTQGQLRMLSIYAAVGVGGLVVLVLLIAAMFTRRGREVAGEAGEVAAEGCVEGCLELLLGGLFGG